MNNNITVRGEFRIELSQLQFEEIVSFLKEKNIKFDVCLQPEITLMENSKDYELKDVLSRYFREKSLKNKTKMNYLLALRQIFSELMKKSDKHWKYVKVNSIDYAFISRWNIMRPKDISYLTTVNSVFSWLKRKNLIAENYVGEYLKNVKETKFKVFTRPALRCEEWIDVKEASDKISFFFSDVRKLLDEEYYEFLVLHFILGTRIRETFNYINAVLSGFQTVPDLLSCVYICTKTTKINESADFRVPVPIFIYELIEKNRVFFGHSDIFISKVIRNAYLRNFRGIFCLHGSRAIYRTIIDFLTRDILIDESAKEVYISHKTDSYVKSRYHRNDYFIERLNLMCIYSKFIFKCAGMPDWLVKVDEYVDNISERVAIRN